MSVRTSWKDRARCAGYNLNIFFSENKVDQEFAVSLCKSCPVVKDCFDNADSEDFRHSVRAGFKPGEYKDGPRRPSFFQKEKKTEAPTEKSKTISAKSMMLKGKDWSHKLGKLCPSGHEYTEENMDAYGRCMACGRIKSARRKSRAKIRG